MGNIDQVVATSQQIPMAPLMKKLNTLMNSHADKITRMVQRGQKQAPAPTRYGRSITALSWGNG